MAVETELKLRISPEHLARLKRHALLKEHQVARTVTRRLYNVYYDTPRLDLHRAMMALRLRRVGGQWLQTLKGGGEVKAGLHSRNEWEIPVSGEALEFPPSPEWDEHLPRPLRKKLRPVFVTDFTRTTRLLDWHGSRIEVCLDHGEIRTEQHSLPICELELELKSGESRSLFELALAILDVVPCELEVVNKAEYGFRLLAGQAERPVKGAMPDIAAAASLPEMLQALIWSCLLHLQANLRGATASDDAEYLHQMRVALRRLRVVLRMAARYRADEQLAALGEEIAALGVALGCIRDWDVFIAGVLEPMRERMPGHPGLQALLAASEHRRSMCHLELHGEEEARDLQRLILRFALWMNGPYWSRPDGDAPRDFAARLLRKLSRRFAEAAQQIDPPEAARLHALRICAKKLRYGSEFFAPLYGRRSADDYLAALGRVQEVLGLINDVAVAHRLLDGLAAGPELAAHQEAVALAKGWIAHGLSRQTGILRKALRRFEEQPAFWKG
ncbi:MAG TPA: CHAD domain-containing protein [Gallionella sp.]|nr:CHAD domain-containing protein [Gallionella sp.]